MHGMQLLLGSLHHLALLCCSICHGLLSTAANVRSRRERTHSAHTRGVCQKLGASQLVLSAADLLYISSDASMAAHEAGQMCSSSSSNSSSSIAARHLGLRFSGLHCLPEVRQRLVLLV